MRLAMSGCEYVGTTTLGYAISGWAEDALGASIGFHDHFKIPHVSHPPGDSKEENDKAYANWSAGKGPDPTRIGLTTEEQELFLALTPNLQEMFQRYHLDYHLQPSFYAAPHHNVIGMHVEEAVYAPLYYGYGGPGEYADRTQMVRHIEERMLEMAPDTVNILVTATPEVIRQRMKDDPHENAVLREKDIEHVLHRFEEEFDKSLISNKFSIDTSTATVDESLAEFVEKIEPFLNDSDRTCILVEKAKKAGEWV